MCIGFERDCRCPMVPCLSSFSLGGLKQQTLISHNLKSKKPKIRVLVDLVSGEGCFQTDKQLSSLCVLTGQKRAGSPLRSLTSGH